MVFSSILVLLGLGFVAAVVLGVASKVLYVKEDPRIAAVEGVLPGANCGGCGYPGCSGAAAAVVSGAEGAGVCVVGGQETAEKVAEVMGLEVEYREPEVASPDCTGGTRATRLYRYEGAGDCRAQALLHGGDKKCGVGCLGLGSCVKACPFDAIHMGPDGYPVVDPEKCRACGKCVDVCPRGVIAVTGMTARLLHLNKVSDCLAPCRQKCPAQINIPRYIMHIRNGDFAAAVQTIKERNPLPLVCGRVCPHPCESVCRRAAIDDPVAINPLKRYAADWEMNSGERLPVPLAPDTGKKVAIIGGGPAGLTCAFFLRRLGHHPHIFEAMPELGGQLRYGIPEYRLPNRILDWEIEGILRLGVDVDKNVNFGSDVTLESLEADGYEAVFMGIGAWEGSNLRAENEEAEGVVSGTEFLTSVGLGVKVELGKKVIVVGGGNTAIDAARTARRYGCDVTLMYRRTRGEMPANDIEVLGAEEEGVEFLFLAGQTRVITDDDGRVTGLEYIKMRLGEPDASGRRRPEPIEGSETIIAVDNIMAAIGQKPDLSCLYEEGGTCTFEHTRWRTLVADPITLQTAIPHVFTGGDVYTGPDIAVAAIGQGRQAARFIHEFITKGAVDRPAGLQRELIASTMYKTIDGMPELPRLKIPELCTEERLCSFDEVELTISDETAQAEARRCLNCGSVCYGDGPEQYSVVDEETAA